MTRCHFCRRPATFSQVALYTDRQPNVCIVPTCQRCFDAVLTAEYAGRLERATGIRWWVAWFSPQLTHPDGKTAGPP